MRKGILSLFLIASLSFTLSTSVFAENNSTPAMKNSAESLPSSYLLKYKGKFRSFDQVYAAFGQEVRPMTNAEKAKGEYAYSVQTPDELAALLSHMKDQKELAESQVQTVYMDKESRSLNTLTKSLNSRENIKTETFEENIYDNYLYWIKGYVTIDYVPRSGKITKTTARSALLGVTYGHIWKPETPRISVLSDIKRQVIFEGVVTTNIVAGGIGEVISTDVSHTMIVQSVPTIEGPIKN